jgi:hypothetical protein
MGFRESSSGPSAATSRRRRHAAGSSMTRKAAQGTKPRTRVALSIPFVVAKSYSRSALSSFKSNDDEMINHESKKCLPEFLLSTSDPIRSVWFGLVWFGGLFF